jgi:CubicO group peptidase (beta-lactamase class C family)
LAVNRRCFIRHAVLLLAGVTGLTAKPPVDIDKALKDWLADRPGGVAAAWIDADGVTYFSAGKFSGTDPRPITADTEFEIGSISKVFTALLLADAVEAGKVKLDAPLGPPFEGSAITYRQLATHTSGLPRLATDFIAADDDDPYADMKLDGLVRSLRTAAATAKPGPSSYSNFGFAVLGHAVAGAWGRPYGELMTERILAPLGLRDTRLAWQEADPARLAPGHNDAGPARNWTLSAYTPAGGLVSTVRDLARFVQENLGMVDTPLATVLAEAVKPQVERGGKGRQIGLAWNLDRRGDRVAIWHNGSTGGYHSFLAFTPEKKQGIVLLTNHHATLDPLGMALLSGRMPAAMPPAALYPPEVKIVGAELDDYVGSYRLGAATFTVTREGERLFARLTGQSAFQVFASAKDEFFYKVVDAQLSFTRNAGGKVDALILHQNGVDRRAERVP